MKRYICNLALPDLPEAMERQCLFLNKFDLSVDPIPVACIHQYLTQKSEFWKKTNLWRTYCLLPHVKKRKTKEHATSNFYSEDQFQTTDLNENWIKPSVWLSSPSRCDFRLTQYGVWCQKLNKSGVSSPKIWKFEIILHLLWHYKRQYVLVTMI